jgi:hypothetical protein
MASKVRTRIDKKTGRFSDSHARALVRSKRSAEEQMAQLDMRLGLMQGALKERMRLAKQLGLDPEVLKLMMVQVKKGASK